MSQERNMPDGPGFNLVEQLKECQAITAKVSDRLDRLVEGVQDGTAGMAIWSLDQLESDCRDLAKRFQKIASVLCVL